jgi:tRNA threonylcarbamoyladenosine biosynthesis protein TsaB
VGAVEGDAVLGERAAPADRTHAGHLPGLVAALLAEAGLTLAELDAIAVSAGPGSFTGLRIGAAFAKGLAYAGDLALVGVPTLEAYAVAAAAPVGTCLCVANDARKGELYAGVFRVVDPGEVVTEQPARAWAPDALRRILPDETLVVGDAGALVAAVDATGLTVRPPEACGNRGAAVARLGARRLAAGERAAIGTFEPTYVREPDATLPARPLR